MDDTQNGADALNVGVDAQQVNDVDNNDTELQQEAVPAQVKEELKRVKQLKLKVYGQEVTEDLPFEVDDKPEIVEYLTKQLQLSKAAQRAMQETQTTRQAAQQLFDMIKGNTKQALIEAGVDPKEFAAHLIEEEIKAAQLSPEEKERQELQSKVKKYEEELRQKEEQYKQKELERLTQMEYERLDKEMSEAIEHSDITKTPYVIEKMARYMHIGLKEGVDIKPQEALQIVRTEMLDELKTIINSLPEDKAEEFIGKEVLDRFRKKNLAKAKQQTPATVKAAIRDIAKTGGKEDGPKPKKFSEVFGNF